MLGVCFYASGLEGLESVSIKASRSETYCLVSRSSTSVTDDGSPNKILTKVTTKITKDLIPNTFGKMIKVSVAFNTEPGIAVCYGSMSQTTCCWEMYKYGELQRSLVCNDWYSH